MRKTTVLLVAAALLAAASCKKDRSNVTPTTQVATETSILKGFDASDVLTYNIQGGSHSIMYANKSYVVSTSPSNAPDVYNISISSNDGSAAGTVKLMNGKAQYVTFDTRPTMNTIFKSSSYQ